MSLESSKQLGGIGAILIAIPFLSLIGIILVLVAMKRMAEYYNDDDIFKNALYGFIFGVIGVIAMVAVILMFAFGYTATTTTVSAYSGFGLFLMAFIVLYVFSLISAIFYRNSLNNLSEKSGEQQFHTAGVILLIGAVIPAVGELLKFIAWILVAVGFFNIKESTQHLPAPPAVSTSEEQKICRHCGKQIQSNTLFCPECGNKTA